MKMKTDEDCPKKPEPGLFIQPYQEGLYFAALNSIMEI